MEKKRDWGFLARAAAVVAALVFVAWITAAVWADTRKTLYDTSGKELYDYSAAAYEDVFKGPDDVLTLYFTPKRSHLWYIRVRMGLAQNADPSGCGFSMKMYDAQGDEIAESSIDTQAYYSGQYLTVWFDGGVEKGKEYRVELRQTQGPGGVFAFYPQPQPLAENQRGLFNGEPLSGAIDAVYYYNYTDQSGRLIVLAADALLAFWAAALRAVARKRQRRGSVALLLLTPLAMYVFVELITGNLTAVEPSFAVVNVLFYGLIFAVFACLFRRLRTGSLLFCLTTGCLALAEHYVLVFRGSALNIKDLFNVGTALSVAPRYTFTADVRLALSIEAYLAFLFAVCYLQNLVWGGEKGEWKAKAAAARLALLAGAVGALIYMQHAQIRVWVREDETVWGKTKGEERVSDTIRTYDIFKMNDVFLLFDNYKHEGFLWSLYLQARSMIVEEPVGYSIQLVEQIVDSASDGERIKDTARISPQNLIVIMNESLADFGTLGDVRTSQEMLPCIRRCVAQRGGSVQVPVFGGGTAQTEYEALTGNSMLFLPAGTDAYTFFCAAPEYGLATTLKGQGYEAIALHPSWPLNWNRRTVYDQMGFEAFIHIENWDAPYAEYNGSITDASAYERLINVVDAKGDAPVFAFMVTIQNHGGYDQCDDDTFSQLSDKWVTLPDQGEDFETEFYLSLANESDRAFENLIAHYEQANKPTMIVFFGDHFPNVKSGIYDRLLSGDPVEEQKRYQTPFVVWTNYPLEAQPPRLMSANYIASTILDLAGLRMTPYDRYLLALRERIPVFGTGYLQDAAGAWYDLDALPEEYETLLEEYRLVQYNRVFDREAASRLYELQP